MQADDDSVFDFIIGCLNSRAINKRTNLDNSGENWKCDFRNESVKFCQNYDSQSIDLNNYDLKEWNFGFANAMHYFLIFYELED